MLCIVYVTLKMLQVYRGHYGHHEVYLTKQQLQLVYQLNVALNIIDPAAVFFARASICAFLFRLIWNVQKGVYVLWLAMCMNAVVFIGTSITFGVQCIPFKRRYDMTSPGRCMNLVHFDDILRIFSGE